MPRLRRNAIRDAAERVSGGGIPGFALKRRDRVVALPFESKIHAASDALKNGVVRILDLNRS